MSPKVQLIRPPRAEGGVLAPLPFFGWMPKIWRVNHAWPASGPYRQEVPVYLNFNPPYPSMLESSEAISLREPALLAVFPRLFFYAVIAVFIPVALSRHWDVPLRFWEIVGGALVLALLLSLMTRKSQRLWVQRLHRRSIRLFLILAVISLALLPSALNWAVPTKVKLAAALLWLPLGFMSFIRYALWRDQDKLFVSGTNLTRYVGWWTPDTTTRESKDIASVEAVTGTMSWLGLGTIIVTFNYIATTNEQPKPWIIRTGSYRTVYGLIQRIAQLEAHLLQRVVDGQHRPIYGQPETLDPWRSPIVGGQSPEPPRPFDSLTDTWDHGKQGDSPNPHGKDGPFRGSARPPDRRRSKRNRRHFGSDDH